MKIRNLFIGLVVLAIFAVIGYLLLTQFGRKAEPPMTLPVDLQKMIPRNWTVLENTYKACDFDGDGEEEWLVLYRYDTTTALQTGPIGGVIYDARAEAAPLPVGTDTPYRPALLIPYKLLPDLYSGKGQGYLGETKAEVHLYPPAQAGRTCKVAEIAIRGFSDNAAFSRLSLFRWDGATGGYIGQHFVGNARVVPSDMAAPITAVTTYNRLNDRSLLCEVRHYARPRRPARRTCPAGSSLRRRKGSIP